MLQFRARSCSQAAHAQPWGEAARLDV